MFARTLKELAGTPRQKVLCEGKTVSTRMLAKGDGLGFSLSDVRLAPGMDFTLWYKHHWEANVVLAGRGRVEDLTTGQSWVMEPGMMYCVGPRDRHAMHAQEDLHLLSVFNPPLRGDEIHDADGTLAASGPIPPGPQGG